MPIDVVKMQKKMDLFWASKRGNKASLRKWFKKNRDRKPGVKNKNLLKRLATIRPLPANTQWN